MAPTWPPGKNKEHAGASGLPRLPAAELEAAVFEQLRGLLHAPGMVAEVVSKAVELDPTLDETQVTIAMTQLDQIWDQLFPAEQQRIVRLLVEKRHRSLWEEQRGRISIWELRLHPGHSFLW